jgi:hypothetical protein
VVHKSQLDILPLRYSSQGGHAEGERVNRGKDPATFCPTLQVLKYVHPYVSVLVVAQLSSEVLEGLINYPVFIYVFLFN